MVLTALRKLPLTSISESTLLNSVKGLHPATEQKQLQMVLFFIIYILCLMESEMFSNEISLAQMCK